MVRSFFTYVSLMTFGFGMASSQQASTIDMIGSRLKVKWENVPRKVLAFYYGWYGNPDVSGRWVHWSNVNTEAQTIDSSTHYPVLGAYDSHDPALVEKHVRWAKEAGIDAFIATWWHPRDFHDRGLPLLLDTAQREGMEISVYFETVPDNDPDKAFEYVEYIVEQYADHPAWLRVDGKPVIFVYGRAVGQIGLDGWLEVIHRINERFPDGVVFIGDRISKNAARIFDGIHTYNITGSTQGKSASEIERWALRTFPRWVQTAGNNRIACVTIIPGYDDTKLGRPDPRPTTERHGGETYRVLWKQAIAADPDWIIITSWNEWHEGSEIEPSVENGDRELRTTADFAPKFTAKPPRQPDESGLPRPALSAEQLDSLRRAFSGKTVAVLPGADSDGFWFLFSAGIEATVIDGERLIDPEVLTPEHYPVLLYAAGEVYDPTVKEKNDALMAVKRYVESGGTLLVMPSNPLPFHYDADGNAGAYWRELGMPMAIGWESPPEGVKLWFEKTNASVLPNVPAKFEFPQSGDLRWRPVSPDQTNVRSLIDLKDETGKNYGSAVAEVRLGKGRIIIAWFTLLTMEQGESLIHDLWLLAIGQGEKP